MEQVTRVIQVTSTDLARGYIRANQTNKHGRNRTQTQSNAIHPPGKNKQVHKKTITIKVFGLTDKKDDFTAKQDGVYSKITKKGFAWLETKTEVTNQTLIFIFVIGLILGLVA